MKYIGVSVIIAAIMAAPATAKDRKVIIPLPDQYLGKMNVVGVDVSLHPASIDLVAFLDDAAEAKQEKQMTSDAPLPPLQSRKSYATMPTILMISEVMTDSLQIANLNSGTNVKLKVSIDTLKLADNSLAILRRPRITLLDLTGCDDCGGSADQIAGFVDVYPENSNQKIGSFYIDILNNYSGLIPPITRGGSVREKLAAAFSGRTALCLSAAKCK